MLDLSTIFGLLMGVGVLFLGVFTTPNGEIPVFLNIAAFAITIGGATAATFISYPMGDLKALFSVVKNAFSSNPVSMESLIQDFRRYADIARRDGILALENVTNDINDPFLVRGIQLAVDGTDPEVINAMMKTELDYLADRHDKG